MYGTKTKQIPKTPDVQKFESRENKALLWNLMYEGKVFENISPNNRVKVEGIFENKPIELVKSLLSALRKGLIYFSLPNSKGTVGNF